MNTDQIAYFIDIAKTGSINTTAKRLYCSQQAVSEAIKRMEQELNCTLLERSKRGVSLTEDGKFVLDHILSMQEHYASLLQHFRHKNPAPSGKLNIGVAPFATKTLLSDLIFGMYHQHPNITLFTEELSASEILSNIVTGRLDFGIAGFSADTTVTLEELHAANLCVQQLYQDHIVCVMHRNNPLSTEHSLTEEHLKNIKYTGYDNLSNTHLQNLVHVSNNTSIHKKFMQEENTICIINYLAFKVLYPEKEFIAIPLEKIDPITMVLFYQKPNDENRILLYQTFVQTILELVHNP